MSVRPTWEMALHGQEGQTEQRQLLVCAAFDLGFLVVSGVLKKDGLTLNQIPHGPHALLFLSASLRRSAVETSLLLYR